MLPLDDHGFPVSGNFEPWFYWKCSLCPCLIFPPTRSLPRSASLASHQRLCVFSLHFLIVSFFSCLFQLSCLQVLMLYLLLSWSNLYAKVFFITRISIWLFYISLYWIHHSFSCVVFNISLSSLLFIPFWVIEDFVPLWLLEHSFNPSLPLIVWDFIYSHSLEPSLWSCWILIFIALVFLHWTLYILDYFHWFIL